MCQLKYTAVSKSPVLLIFSRCSCIQPVCVGLYVARPVVKPISASRSARPATTGTNFTTTERHLAFFDNGRQQHNNEARLSAIFRVNLGKSVPERWVCKRWWKWWQSSLLDRFKKRTDCYLENRGFLKFIQSFFPFVAPVCLVEFVDCMFVPMFVCLFIVLCTLGHTCTRACLRQRVQQHMCV